MPNNTFDLKLGTVLLLAGLLASLCAGAAGAQTGTAPVILAQPQSIKVNPGERAVFLVDAAGSGPLAYTWYKGSTEVASGPDNSFAIEEVQQTDEGSYHCRVANTYGQTTSAPAFLTVADPPTIMSATTSVTCAVGMNVELFVTASGEGPIYYEWYKEGEIAPVGEGSVLSIESAQLYHAGSYRCRVWNAAGAVYSGYAVLRVIVPPSIVTNLLPQSVAGGDSVVFTVVAAGGEPLQYEWYKNGVLLIGCPCPSYMISNVQPQDAGIYHCVVRNEVGLVESARVPLTVGLRPAILEHPRSRTVTAGDAATFQVVAGGTAPLHYEWSKDKTVLPWADSPTFFVAPVTMADAGQYACRVWNDYGEDLSYPATLSVSGVPRPAFSYYPHSGPAPLNVTFTDMSLPGSSAIQSWYWGFGDGTFGTGDSIVHTYTQPGIYTVRLTATNAEFANTAVVPLAVRVYAGAATDSDGDGLTDRDETGVYGTNPNDPDSDADGMDDGWEVAFQLDPTSSSDATQDADSDELTNLEEYRLRSDPLDDQSPARVYYVKTNGNDANEGSFEFPWRTIKHAITELEDMGVSVTVRLAPGVYDEDLTLPSWMTLAGLFARDEVVISGYIAGSANSALENLTVRDPLPGEPYPLLTINGPMKVAGVAFEGGTGSTADGVVVEGGGWRGSLIQRCEFCFLKNGVVINDAIPLIRRCWFHDLSGSAIIVRERPVPLKQDDGTLSTAADPGSGYNTIDLETIKGRPAVLNERDFFLVMENNDWNTDDAEEIESGVSEGTDYEPYLKGGSAAAAATVNCIVWDAETLEPITDATITLAPGTFLPLTENTGGVYTFACLEPAAYTFSVTANGYSTAVQSRTVAAGDNLMLHFPLGPSGDDSEDPPGCFGVTKKLQHFPPSGNYAGDLAILFAATVLAVLGKRLRWKRA